MNRLVIACLTLAAVGGPAWPALAQTAPAGPMAPIAPAAAPATPAAAAPTIVPAAAAPAVPAGPVRPTTGIGANVLSLLDNVCMPLITGSPDLKQLTKAAGLRMVHDDWVLRLQGVEKITVVLPNNVNPNSCSLTVDYQAGQGAVVLDALSAWAATQATPLKQDRVALQQPSYDHMATTTNWIGANASTRMGLAFSELKKLDGSPYIRNGDEATVLFSYRALNDLDRAQSAADQPASVPVAPAAPPAK